MGKIEDSVAKNVRRTKTQRAILEAVGSVGVLAFALVAPNAVQMFGKLFGYGKKKVHTNTILKARKRLIDSGHLESKDGFVSLTSKGEFALRQILQHTNTLPRPKRWDGKWRLIIFDISESRRGIRDRVRATLVSIGFVRLQQSVWVYPYPCDDFLVLLKADFKIGKDVLYLVADEVEGDGWLRKEFGLHVT